LDGTFIVFFSNLIKGLVGWGFWITAPALLLCAIILGFHRGRPVALRLTSALFLMPFFAAMAHLLFYDPNMGEFDFTVMVGMLFEQGQNMTSGGVIGGLLAEGLKMAFSIYGAFPILLVAFIFCLIASLNTSLKNFFVKLKGVGSVKYDPAVYKKEEPLRAEKTAMPVKEKSLPKQDKTPKIWDIPLGEESETFELNDLRGKDIEDALKETASKNRIKAKVVRIERSPADIALGETEDDSEFKELPPPEETPLKPVTVSAEISDPPKSKNSAAHRLRRRHRPWPMKYLQARSSSTMSSRP